MEILIYILIGLVALVTIFIGFTVVKDAVKERKEEKAKAEEAKEETPVEEKPIVPETPAVIEEEAKEEKETPEEVLVPQSDVSFDVKSKTLEEKYLALSPEYKGYYDEIVKVAMSVENSKRIKNASYEDYKLGKNRLVRLKIKREQVVAELIIPNLSFKTYTSEGNNALKAAPSIVKVVDEASLNAVKEGIAYTLKAIDDEKAYKKELAKEKRRKAKEEKETLANDGEDKTKEGGKQ